MQFAFLYFYHTDKANAAIHQAEVKFSPITFALADELFVNGLRTTEIYEVQEHHGKYKLDPGR